MHQLQNSSARVECKNFTTEWDIWISLRTWSCPAAASDLSDACSMVLPQRATAMLLDCLLSAAQDEWAPVSEPASVWLAARVSGNSTGSAGGGRHRPDDPSALVPDETEPMLMLQALIGHMPGLVFILCLSFCCTVAHHPLQMIAI